MTLQTFTGIEHVVVSKTVMKIAPLPIAIKIPVMSGYRNNTLVKVSAVEPHIKNPFTLSTSGALKLPEGACVRDLSDPGILRLLIIKNMQP